MSEMNENTPWKRTCKYCKDWLQAHPNLGVCFSPANATQIHGNSFHPSRWDSYVGCIYWHENRPRGPSDAPKTP